MIRYSCNGLLGFLFFIVQLNDLKLSYRMEYTIHKKVHAFHCENERKRTV